MRSIPPAAVSCPDRWQPKESQRKLTRAGDFRDIGRDPMIIPPCRRNLVVITNSVQVAGLFMERSTARVLVPGGCRPVIVYGLFTSSKETGLGLHSFAETAEITALYTDDEISSDFVDDWRARKVAVQVVPAFDRFARPGISVNGRARILSSG